MSGRPRSSGKTVDKHLLYQLSVQEPTEEARFIARIFRRSRGRPATSLREDFCGTAALCAAWVTTQPGSRATGVDVDPKVLAWAREHNVAPLGSAARRVTLRTSDVRKPPSAPHELIVAFNYSYWVFRTRAELAGYFKTVRRSLARGGLFMLDAYGGSDAQVEVREQRRVKGGFLYEWHQAKFNPIDHSLVNYIHFVLPDGTRMEKAFRYEWRHWSLPELTELLTEAGFCDVAVWWDRSPKQNEERYRPTKVASNSRGWLAYLVAKP